MEEYDDSDVEEEGGLAWSEPTSGVQQTLFGYGSKVNDRKTARFSRWFHLPGLAAPKKSVGST